MSSFLPSFLPFDLKRGAFALVAALAAAALPQSHAAGVPGQGTWETTLQARDLDGNLSNGPEAFFDTVLNITWLADGNYANSKDPEFISTNPVAESPGSEVTYFEGRMGWDFAQDWVSKLNVNGVTGWRLPTVDVGAIEPNFGYSTNASELAHMYVVTLGNKAAFDASNNQQVGWGLTNSGPFSNLQTDYYWSNSEFAPMSDDAWWFSTRFGEQSSGRKYDGLYSWAVHSGDVAAISATTGPVPEPENCVLALAGLAAIVAVGKRRA